MKFFNRMPSPLVVVMSSGTTLVAQAKAWFSIPDHEASSASIIDHVAKGHISAGQPEPTTYRGLPENTVPVVVEPILAVEVVPVPTTVVKKSSTKT